MSEVSNGWLTVRLGDICEPSQYGYTAKAGSSGNVHFLRTTDITSGPINWATVPFCDVDEETQKKYLLHDGDVVISRAGSVGFSCLIRQPLPSVFASYLIRFRPKINADYFRYFLLTPNYWDAIGKQSLGIAVQNVNATSLSEIEVPVAPAAEQTRIVAKLEELLSDLDAGVAELKAAQKKLVQYRQSLLKAAVEGALTAEWRAKHPPTETGEQLLERILNERRARWEAKQLTKFEEQGKAVPKGWQAKYPEPVQPDTTGLPALPKSWAWASLDALVIDGPQNGLYLPADRYGSGTPILRIDDYQIGWCRDRSVLNLVDADTTTCDTYGLCTGDLVINRVNSMTHLGKSVLITEQLAGVLFESNMMRLALASAVSGQFVANYLGSEIGRARLIRDAKWAVNQASINQQDVRRIPVPLPPEQEQYAIAVTLAEQLQASTAQGEAIERSRQQSTAQRQNILRAAFSGQLVPQDPNDEPASVLLERIRTERAARDAMKKPRGRQAKEAAA